MTELSTETFSIQVPELLDQSRAIWETIRAESTQLEYKLQNPELNFALLEQTQYSELVGDDFYARFCSHLFEAYQNPEFIERIDLQIAGKLSVVQIGRIFWEWDGKKADVFYLSAALALDETYHLEMKAFCEEQHWVQFRPVFLEVWASLKTFGDCKAALRKQEQELEAIHSRYSSAEPAKLAVKPFRIPENGKELFRVDGLQFAFDTETSLEISDQVFSATLKAQVPIESQGKSSLFDEYQVANGVGFRMRFSGIHQAGVPTGEFLFEHGKSEDRRTYLWDDGWEYSLEFSGLVTLQEGWLGMNGHLSEQWDPVEHFELELYKRIDLGSLEWTHYRFASLEETDSVEPQLVQYLNLSSPSFETLPERLLEFTNLKELSIAAGGNHYMASPPKLPLKELPEGLRALKDLRSLSISGASLQALPEALGELRELENLQVSHCELRSTPLSMWQLPKLNYLYLSNNSLNSIPEQIALPELTNLDLSNNQFQTLPPELALQKRLRKIDLNSNPLQMLPPEFNQIAEIELALNDKLRLLDFTYRGADASGTVEWDDVTYYARSQTEFCKKLEKHEHSEALLQVARHALVFKQDEKEDYSQLGNTRFGGWPDLPASILYPRFGQNETPGKIDYVFEFLAQINCQELAPLQDYLPREGILYFFLDTVHEMTPKVLYWNGDLAELASGQSLCFEEDDFFEHLEPPYKAYKSQAVAEISLPFSYSSYTNTHIFEGAAQKLTDPEELLEEVRTELGLQTPQNAHEINSYVFTQHECPELQAALKKKGQPQDWMVLLKLASIGDFQWWDAGELYFVIHKSDLAKGDFSNIFCGLESS